MSAMFLPGSRNFRKCFRDINLQYMTYGDWPIRDSECLEAVMDWIGPSSNGLSKCINNQAKYI